MDSFLFSSTDNLKSFTITAHLNRDNQRRLCSKIKNRDPKIKEIDHHTQYESTRLTTAALQIGRESAPTPNSIDRYLCLFDTGLQKWAALLLKEWLLYIEVS
jgi:hypothetical protein